MLEFHSWSGVESKTKLVKCQVSLDRILLRYSRIYRLTCIDIYITSCIQGPESPHYDTRLRKRERERGGKEKSGCFLYGLIVRPSSCCHGAYRSEVWDGLRSMAGERETREEWVGRGGKEKERNSELIDQRYRLMLVCKRAWEKNEIMGNILSCSSR